MKAKTSIFGRIVKCYNLPLDGIEDFPKILLGEIQYELPSTLIASSKLQLSRTSQPYVDSVSVMMIYIGGIDLYRRVPLTLTLIMRWLIAVKGEVNRAIITDRTAGHQLQPGHNAPVTLIKF